jgi:hypothetical protein
MHVPAPDTVELPRILRRALVGCVCVHAVLSYVACDAFLRRMQLLRGGAGGVWSDAGMGVLFGPGAE